MSSPRSTATPRRGRTPSASECARRTRPSPLPAPRSRSPRPSSCSVAGSSCSGWSRSSGLPRRASRDSAGLPTRRSAPRRCSSPRPVSCCSRRLSAGVRPRRSATYGAPRSGGRWVGARSRSLAAGGSARRSPAGARRGSVVERCWRQGSPPWPPWRSTSRPDTRRPAARRERASPSSGRTSRRPGSGSVGWPRSCSPSGARRPRPRPRPCAASPPLPRAASSSWS